MQHYNFRIYLASDDPGLFEQWREEFAGRMVLSDISTGSADITGADRRSTRAGYTPTPSTRS
jgi:hypothetical protein